MCKSYLSSGFSISRSDQSQPYRLISWSTVNAVPLFRYDRCKPALSTYIRLSVRKYNRSAAAKIPIGLSLPSRFGMKHIIILKSTAGSKQQKMHAPNQTDKAQRTAS